MVSIMGLEGWELVPALRYVMIPSFPLLSLFACVDGHIYSVALLTRIGESGERKERQSKALSGQMHLPM